MHGRGNNLYMCVGKAVMLVWGLLRLAPIRLRHALQPLSGYPGCRYSGYEKLILVVEVNCTSNLSPNHTLQLTTIKTSVRSHYNCISNLSCFCGDSSFTDVQWLLYLARLCCYCMLFGTNRCLPWSLNARSQL